MVFETRLERFADRPERSVDAEVGEVARVFWREALRRREESEMLEVGRWEVRELEGSVELVPRGEDDELEEESDMADVEGGRETRPEGGVPSRRPTKQSSQCGAYAH